MVSSLERTTAYADEQKQHLKKTLADSDIVLIVMSAVLSIEVPSPRPQVSAQRPSPGHLVLAIFFLAALRARLAARPAALSG